MPSVPSRTLNSLMTIFISESEFGFSSCSIDIVSNMYSNTASSSSISSPFASRLGARLIAGASPLAPASAASSSFASSSSTGSPYYVQTAIHKVVDFRREGNSHFKNGNEACELLLQHLSEKVARALWSPPSSSLPCAFRGFWAAGALLGVA